MFEVGRFERRDRDIGALRDLFIVQQPTDDGSARVVAEALEIARQRVVRCDAVEPQPARSAIRRNALISVRSLSGYTSNPDEVDLFYAEVRSLVDFLLRTYGKDKVGELLEAIRAGLYQEEALQKVYGFGLDELDLQWRVSLGLGPRPTPGTPTEGASPSSGQRPSLPCPTVWLGGSVAMAGLAAVGGRRRHAGAS